MSTSRAIETHEAALESASSISNGRMAEDVIRPLTPGFELQNVSHGGASVDEIAATQRREKVVPFYAMTVSSS